MSTLMPPYTDLSLDVSYVRTPYDATNFEYIFQKYFTSVLFLQKQQIDIQFSLTDVYLVTASKMKDLSPFDNVTLPSTKSTLLVSGNLFYLLVSLGNNHILGSSITGFLKKDTETFSKVSGGRFTNNLSKNIISVEEDEIGCFYVLLSNQLDLLNIDELFNFSRHILNS